MSLIRSSPPRSGGCSGAANDKSVAVEENSQQGQTLAPSAPYLHPTFGRVFLCGLGDRAELLEAQIAQFQRNRCLQGTLQAG